MLHTIETLRPGPRIGLTPVWPEMQPRDVIGISQVLPVVVAALSPASLVTIEQPLHIHPSVQVACDLLVYSILRYDMSFLIETHSGIWSCLLPDRETSEETCRRVPPSRNDRAMSGGREGMEIRFLWIRQAGTLPSEVLMNVPVSCSDDQEFALIRKRLLRPIVSSVTYREIGEPGTGHFCLSQEMEEDGL